MPRSANPLSRYPSAAGIFSLRISPTLHNVACYIGNIAALRRDLSTALTHPQRFLNPEPSPHVEQALLPPLDDITFTHLELERLLAYGGPKLCSVCQPTLHVCLQTLSIRMEVTN